MKYLKRINEDTIKNYSAWNKEIIIGCDNDQDGGFIDIMVDGKQAGKVYIISPEELEQRKLNESKSLDRITYNGVLDREYIDILTECIESDDNRIGLSRCAIDIDYKIHSSNSDSPETAFINYSGIKNFANGILSIQSFSFAEITNNDIIILDKPALDHTMCLVDNNENPDNYVVDKLQIIINDKTKADYGAIINKIVRKLKAEPCVKDVELKDFNDENTDDYVIMYYDIIIHYHNSKADYSITNSAPKFK